jgi:hypothetical protein
MKYSDIVRNLAPVFENYPAFKKLLTHFTQANWGGCRSSQCAFPNCGVTACHKEKGVDFCFQCDEFPCDKTHFDPDLEERWKEMGRRMQDIGIEAYYEQTKDRPRYA